MAPVSTKRILISNDDGIRAPGLEILERVARQFSDDVWVVAPEDEQSGASHSLTLTRPLRVRELGPKRWAISGTPTDCVMMALNKIMADNLPTLILSGVNRGGNLAEDVTYSGTVSVAMEGTLAGIPSIALSQCIRPDEPVYWETAERHAPEVIKNLLDEGWPADVLMNVNFPAFAPDEIGGVRLTEQGRRQMVGTNITERVDPRGFKYYWFGLGREVGIPGHQTDLKSVREKWISVTPLHLDLTHHETRQALQGKIERAFKA
ncbi:5'/3'-nucleotidase SurE [Kordiimonas marina]|uniref:5'/3'-nucleotidase SurE n=1 Tax=Kordiimonas marina TaxID=2872312 RepID=UPI001FF2ACB9|nr:5'/3'-nucleotidase SurE [Kordiimonas marina]MCJ9430259.1 5'/3'-nucleotidase SurE [Kordiimonas marina]